MDFSLFYFANDSRERDRNRYELLLEGARFADRNGFAAVWTPERHFHPFGGLYPNPSVTGAAVALATERIAVRAGSVVAPLHHPARIAEEWSVVDNLSGGRVGISFASGWHAVDFALRPETYADRKRILLDSVQTVRRLWRGETVEWVDGAGKPRQIAIFPPPVQAELPVWITSGGSVDTFRAAGRARAGLLTHLLGQDLPSLAAKISVYRRAAARHGDGWPGHVVLMVHTFLGDDDDAVRALVRGPMLGYLRSSLGLVLGSGGGAPAATPDLSDKKAVSLLVERAFERYYDDGGLFGTVDRARRVVEQVRAIGVDEIACLVDFGLPARAVISGLDQLNELRQLAQAAVPA
jgi:natural product biosynthesis luciferase-like monooxygenase protein